MGLRLASRDIEMVRRATVNSNGCKVFRNLLRQNSFWLQRLDLNQRPLVAEPVLTRQVLYELLRQSQTARGEPLVETKVFDTVLT